MDGTNGTMPQPQSLEALREAVEAKRLAIELAALNRIEESWGTFSQYVDPIDALRDERTGDMWVPVSGSSDGYDAQALTTGVQTEAQLTQIRQYCRQIAIENPHAQTIIENCKSFVIGAGILYQASLKKTSTAKPELAQQVQDVIENWVKKNKWYLRQEEIIQRQVRDGEAFLRIFPQDGDELPLVRFVEPGLIADPQGSTDGNKTFGIETDPDDVETVLRYWIAGKPVDASLIQHRKIGVDMNVKRGIPLLWSIRRECKRAEATRRNMATVYGAQTAIAGVRKHSAKAAEVDVMIGRSSQVTRTDPTGKATSFNIVAPGSFVDIPQGMEFELSSAKVNVAAGREVVQADLRAAGARLCMPEYMISGDASNANMASTMVAESPSVRFNQRWQGRHVEQDLEIIDIVLKVAVAKRLLPPEALTDVCVEATPPNLVVRNRESEARANQIEHQEGVRSRRTWRQQVGLDHDTEEANFAEERESAMEFQTQLGLKPQNSGNEDDKQNPDDNPASAGRTPSGDQPPSENEE